MSLPASVEPVNEMVSTPGVGDQVLAGFVASRGDVDHAVGDSCLNRELSEQILVQRGFGCTIDDDRASREQGQRDLVERDEMRRIPRNECTEHPEGPRSIFACPVGASRISSDRIPSA
nr:hypothetical protein [Brevibacterium sp. VCM10]